jgi:two-component system, NtrC family, nitrogen regulation response regulator GlnG
MTGATILLADDDAGIRTVLTEALSRRGHEVRATANAATLWQWVTDGDGDLVITDVVMPDGNGLDLLPRLRRARPKLPVIVMSAQSTLLTAVRAAQGGAYEYLPKPFDLGELVGLVDRALRRPGARRANGDGEGGPEGHAMVGRSAAMQELFRTVARLAGTDLTAIVIGESGTGKELVARALHDFGRRRNGPFVAVNMAAIPRELVESELFGHEKGAFTGASARREGRFTEARGGTLFLDEIGDMPPEAQTRLLRVLQQGEYTPVGARGTVLADVRIVAATNRDPLRLVRQGLLREDLYYRLNVVPLRVPALRERREDIPALVARFVERCAEEGLEPKVFGQSAMARLQSYDWPGNVRELDNLVRRLLVLTPGAEVAPDAVDRELRSGPPGPQAGNGEGGGLGGSVERHLRDYFAAHAGELPSSGLYDRVLREVERPLIELTMVATRGNQLRAAEVLGLNRNTLRKKIRGLGIAIGRGARE